MACDKKREIKLFIRLLQDITNQTTIEKYENSLNKHSTSLCLSNFKEKCFDKNCIFAHNYSELSLHVIIQKIINPKFLKTTCKSKQVYLRPFLNKLSLLRDDLSYWKNYYFDSISENKINKYYKKLLILKKDIYNWEYERTLNYTLGYISLSKKNKRNKIKLNKIFNKKIQPLEIQLLNIQHNINYTKSFSKGYELYSFNNSPPICELSKENEWYSFNNLPLGVKSQPRILF